MFLRNIYHFGGLDVDSPSLSPLTYSLFLEDRDCASFFIFLLPYTCDAEG